MKMVALLKGVNVGGNKKVSMARLIELAKNSGLTEVRSYLNSGNLVFEASKLKPESVGETLESGIEKEFGFKVDVIVRTAAQWKKYASGSPFPKAETMRPKMLHLGVSRIPFKRDMVQDLADRAVFGEKIEVLETAIWVDFFKSVGKSKLKPALFDRLAGSPVTMRNWNTVIQLNEMLNG